MMKNIILFIILLTTVCYASVSNYDTYRVGDGSLSSPAIQFNKDPNTGIFRKADDRIGIVAGGVEVIDVENNKVSVLDLDVTGDVALIGSAVRTLTMGDGILNISTNGPNQVRINATGFMILRSGSVDRLLLGAGDSIFNESGADTNLRIESDLSTAAFFLEGSSGNIGINTSSPNASALLDLTSTTKGFLPSRMTTAQRDAIGSPATGLEIYNTTTNTPNFFNGTVWGETSGTAGATQALDNLSSVQINSPLIYGAGVSGVLKTNDNGAGNSENLTIGTGTATCARGGLTIDALTINIQ